jgi:valyl-tRNA synthetase
VIRKYGADALRHWASGTHLGSDSRYNERNVKDGRRLVVKLWNAARFVLMQLEGFDPAVPRPAFEERTPEDRWLLSELNRILPVVEARFEAYDYAGAREQIDRFFWPIFCDDYLEIVKDRFWNLERYPEASRVSGRATLWESLRTVLALYAPFVPFVTEGVYQRIYRPFEQAVSIHVTSWPQHVENRPVEVPEMNVVTAILRGVRRLRSEQQIPQTRSIAALTIDLRDARQDVTELVRRMEQSLRAASRASDIRYDKAEGATELEGIRIGVEATSSRPPGSNREDLSSFRAGSRRLRDGQ